MKKSSSLPPLVPELQYNPRQPPLVLQREQQELKAQPPQKQRVESALEPWLPSVFSRQQVLLQLLIQAVLPATKSKNKEIAKRPCQA
jgi:hypothetical protein